MATSVTMERLQRAGYSVGSLRLLRLNKSSSPLHLRLAPYSHRRQSDSPDMIETMEPTGDSATVERSPTPETLTPPEKQYTCLLVAVGAWCGLFPVAGILNSLGTFQTYVSLNQLNNHTTQQVGWIFSMYPFLLAFGGGQVGPILDAYGPKWLMITGDIALMVALLTFSVCEEYYQFFLSFGLLGGVAAACIWTTTLVTTGHWFSKNRGIATALITTSGPIGGICFPILFEALIPRVGFAWTIRVIALICLVMAGISLVLMRSCLPPSGRVKWNTTWKIFTEMDFGLTVIAMFCVELSFLVPPAYITPYALSIDLDSTLAYQLLAIMNAANVPGRLIPGLLADRWGRFNVMILCSLPCAASILVLWMIAKTKVLVIAFAVIFGFLSATASSLAPVCVSQLCSTEDYGSKCGTAYLYLSPAVLAGIPVAGQLVDVGGQGGAADGSSYRWLILMCGLAYLSSAIFFMLARIVGGGTRIRKKF